MHASIDQLLSLRDGEPVDAAVRVHVQQCKQCLAESTLLAKARLGLQGLASFDAPPNAWAQIEARAATRPARRASISLAAAAAALVVGIVAFVAMRDDEADAPQLANSSIAMPVAAHDSAVQELIAQSRELDELLQYLPDRPQVERVSLAATVDTIEERIQVLDWQLAYSADSGLDQRQAHRLWSERVELMDSLVKVRYAESAPMTF